MAVIGKKESMVDTLLSNALEAEDKTILDSFLRSYFENIKKKYGLEGKELFVCLKEKDEFSIPCSIFHNSLGALECIVKFLHENKGMKFSEISGILQKTQNNLAVTYSKGKKKFPKRFDAFDYTNKIPFSSFSKKNTCLESVCLHLKDSSSLNYSQIGRILDRDQRTIWTTVKKARAKRGESK